MSETTHLYLIRCLSNLHAGAGDQSFGIIDKHIQRDPTTHLPTVFGSSLKGALREKTSHFAKDEVETFFGSDNLPGKEKDLSQGGIVVSDARLLALPVRSSHKFYYLATCREILQDFIDVVKSSGAKIKGLEALQELLDKDIAIKIGTPKVSEFPDKGPLFLEEWEAKKLNLKIEAFPEGLNSRLALFNARDFAILARDLPTVARNALENGISQNLWYEEIVPRESLFYCTVSIAPGGYRSNDPVKLLHEKILTEPDKKKSTKAKVDKKTDNKVQVGANATVGYGQTEWTLLGSASNQNTSTDE